MLETLKIWAMAARPKTLTAAVAPVLMGTFIALDQNSHHWLTALLCLLGALMIQIGTNLSNDYYDFQKGTDDEERIGPQRVTQSGLVKPGVVKFAFILAFALSALIGLTLMLRGGWPIVLITVVSIISGYLYTGGPKPLGYLGLGDLFVLIFFGPVAVAGTYYVQALRWDMITVWAGLAPGLISVAILAVNNLRDIEGDARSGKKTLAVRFGRTFARWEYALSMLIPVGMVYGFYAYHPGSKIWIAALTFVFMLSPLQTVWKKTEGPALNKVLGQTGKVLLIYSLLFSIGWVL